MDFCGEFLCSVVRPARSRAGGAGRHGNRPPQKNGLAKLDDVIIFSVPCSLFPVPCSLFPVPCSLLPISFRLQVEKVGVALIACHQLFVTAKFDDAPFGENHNAICHPNG